MSSFMPPQGPMGPMGPGQMGQGQGMMPGQEEEPPEALLGLEESFQDEDEDQPASKSEEFFALEPDIRRAAIDALRAEMQAKISASKKFQTYNMQLNQQFFGKKL